MHGICGVFTGHGQPMFAMASRPPPKLHLNDSTSRLHVGWGLPTAAPQPADSLGEVPAGHLGWNVGARSSTTVAASDAELTRGGSHGGINFDARARSDEAALTLITATNSEPASRPAVETEARGGPTHAPGIGTPRAAGAKAPKRAEHSGGASGACFDTDSDGVGGQVRARDSCVALGTEPGTEATAVAAIKQSQSDVVHFRLDTNTADFVSVLTRPRPGPSPLDVLRALPAAPVDVDLENAHGSMAGGSAAALVGSTMAGSSSGWASIAGTQALEDAAKQQQHAVSGSSATSLSINGMRDAT